MSESEHVSSDAPLLAAQAVAAVNDIGAREQAFWDEHVPGLEHCLREYEAGPDANTSAMLDALEPVRGRRVLDFACGPGVTSVWLAQRGAIVTALDISPASIERARRLADRTGLAIEFIAAELRSDTFPPGSFDAIAGRYALHHVDLTVIAPIFDAILVPGGVGGFVETMGLNPLLNLSRRRLAGRAGVASYGSEDERPLTGTDLRVLESEIGPVRLTTGRMEFLRIFDRNVLRHRHPRASTVLGSIDDALSRAGLTRLSYHQVVTVLKQPALAGPAGPDRVAAR
jgi:SAM-dependent methyltransferase